MLDINFIRENSDKLKKVLVEKNMKFNLDELLQVDVKRREVLQEVETLRQARNQAAQDRDIEKGKEVKQKLEGLEEELKKISTEFDELMLEVPNIPSSDSPIGPDSDSNKELFKVGEIPEFDFEILDHIELGRRLDIIDLEAGTKVSGFRGYFLKNEGAILHWAILKYAQDKILEKDFKMMVPPTLVHDRVLVGSGHFPHGKENVYQIANPGKIETGEEIKNPIYLTGTSEPSLLAYFLDKTLSEDELPIKVSALTHCYRSEVGDYGRDTRGLYRIHEFDKVEQVVICKNDLEESEKYFELMQKISEEILQALNLPYRVIAVCTGDMGTGKYRQNDIETWMPSRAKYGETHSNSNLTDWQARRLNLKFKTEQSSSSNKDGKTAFVYTLNNTVIASPRILIPLLEIYQQKDGSVKIPEVLVPYTKFSSISPKKS